MELLDVRLTGIQRRNRAAFVSRADLPGTTELVAGQKVVLRDEHGEFFAGTVVDVDDDERCLVHLGVRLPAEYALIRLGRSHGSHGSHDGHGAHDGARNADGPQEDQGVQEVLDLLGDAREVLVGAMPGQRRGG